MNPCRAFEGWLDEGMPGGRAAVNAAHAEGCTNCRAQWHAAREMEATFARVAVRPPDGFTGHVMARVAAVEAARRSEPVALDRDVLPWWVRAAAEPSVAAALALSALVLWQAPALVRGAQNAAAWLGDASTRVLASPAGVRPEVWPVMMLAFALALLPAAVWAAQAAYRWTEHVMAQNAFAPGRLGPRFHA